MKEANDRHSSAGSERIVIKKYANRRLYDTEASVYVTLEDLARMVREDRDFVVRDAKTGSDLTHSVLTQIIVEQESKADGPTLLPVPFLRQLICYYDDAVGKMVPGYLQMSMAALAKEQERYRTQLRNWGPNAFEIYQEQARKNMEIFENAFALWAPHADAEQEGAPQEQDNHAKYAQSAHFDKHPKNNEQDTSASRAQTTEASGNDACKQSASPTMRQDKISEIDELRAQLAIMQEKIEKISQSQ